jgi:hypothetical protein
MKELFNQLIQIIKKIINQNSFFIYIYGFKVKIKSLLQYNKDQYLLRD